MSVDFFFKKEEKKRQAIMEEEITICPICSKTLINPRSLPCLHSFCEACLKGSVEESDLKPRCPKCHFPFEIPLQGLSALGCLVFTERVLQSKNASDSKRDENLCELCEENDCRVYCKECRQFLCEGCQRAHKRSRASLNHQFTTPEEGDILNKLKKRIGRCSRHPAFEVTMYCDDDSELACPLCSVEYHKGHILCTTDEFLEKCNNSFDERIKYALINEAKIKDELESTRLAQDKIEKDYEEAKSDILKTFEDLRSFIDRREAILICQVEDTKDTLKKHLVLQTEGFEFFLHSIETALKYCKHLRNEGTFVEIARTQYQVLSQFKSIEEDFDRMKRFLNPLSREISVISLLTDTISKNIDQIIQMCPSVEEIAFQTFSLFPDLKPVIPPSLPPSTPKSQRDYSKVKEQPLIQFGSQRSGNGQLCCPFAVTVDSEGLIYAAGYGNDQIQVFSSDGKFIYEFGSKGKGNRQFDGPCGIIFDPKLNEIIVADSGNGRIQIFSADGKYIRTIGEKGEQNLQLNHPIGMALDKNGNVLVADCNGNNIKMYSKEGNLLMTFGSKGKEKGQLHKPYGIGILSNGNIVVSEEQNNRLSVFNSEGYFIRCIDFILDNGEINLVKPRHIFIDDHDHILVVDFRNDQILMINQEGKRIATIGKGILGNPFGITMDQKGRIIVSESYPKNRITIFPGFEPVKPPPLPKRDYSKVKKPLIRFGSKGNGVGQFDVPWSVAVDSKGFIYVVEGDNNRIQKFDVNGTYIKQFGTEGKLDGQLSHPCGIIFDPTRNEIIVADTGNHRIQFFSTDGTHIKTIGNDRQLNEPHDMALDKNGNIVVANQQGFGIKVFSREGNLLKEFGTAGKGNYEIRGTWGVGILSNGNIVVSENSKYRLSLFTSEGEFIRFIGEGKINSPRQIFVDGDDNILISSYGNDKIFVYDQEGKKITSLAKGFLESPSGVTMGQNGKIITVETSLHRISIF